MRLDEFATSKYSQNGEDGIIAHIFSVIGFESRLFIEFGFGVPECNSLKLIEDEGFGGLFIDETAVCDDMTQRMAKEDRDVRVRLRHLTAENVESALRSMPEDIDLLSIDIDGNDYWLWKAIERIKPRLVVIEMNGALGPDVSVTIPYDPEFAWDRGNHYGASLKALEQLGKAKGYKLIGCEPKGVNAFFLRDDIEGFDAVDVKDAVDWESISYSFETLRHEWEEV